MSQHYQNMIIGQGLAGSAIAWRLHWSGESVLLIDADEPDTASRVAAGLITPVTGKRLVRSPDFEQYWKEATSFYRRVEQTTGTAFFEETPMIRLLDPETAEALSSLKDGAEPWEGRLQSGGQVKTGVKLTQAGRLNVLRYLDATRAYFDAADSYRTAKVVVEKDIDIGAKICWKALNVTADRLILCQGSEQSGLFPDVPNNRSHGDILKVRIKDYQRTEVVHKSIWIAAEKNGDQTVGSTYDWTNLTGGISTAGKKEVLNKLSGLVDGDVEVVDHKSGVRPTMKDYEPVLGCHPNSTNVFIFNGLGSKGSLKAPKLASDLEQFMSGQSPVDQSINYQRLVKKELGRRPLTKLAQEAVASVVCNGDTAIDGTVGNGFDTCFLAEKVGDTGQVIGFDVQKKAIESTLERLKATGFNNVRLLFESHEKIASIVAKNTVKAVMFNLGYLPGGDHSLITEPRSSTKGIAAAIETLTNDGILTVLAYRGHSGGEEEFTAVERLLQQYSDKHAVERIDSTPPKPTSPVLFVLKLKKQGRRK